MFGRDSYRRGGPLGALRAVPAFVGRVLWSVAASPLALVKFVRVSAAGREGRNLWQGLPALAAGLTVAFLAAAVAVRAPFLPDQYREAAEEAEAAGDTELALTLYDRLSRLERGGGGTAFDRAQLLSKTGEDEQATTAMRALTLRRPPEPRAHVWLAERLLTGPGVTLAADHRPEARPAAAGAAGGGSPGTDYKPTAEQAVVAARHLDAALKTGLGDAPRVHGRLAEVMLLFGRRDDAVRHLKAESAADPSRLLALAELLAAVGRDADAETAYRRSAAYLQEKLLEDPADWPTRRRLALALVRSGSEAAARDVLRRGLRGGSDGAGARLLSDLLVREVRRLGLLESDRAMPLLREALRLTPGSQRALAELASLAVGGDSGADAALDDLLTSGTAGGTVHLAAGLRASGRGEEDAALFHYARAYELDPTLSFAANNLAYLLARKDGGAEREKALSIADGLVERFPEVPNFRDTRGGILLLEGRTEDAVRDLEAALAGGMAGNRELHGNLAAAYESLGQESLAAAHRRRAEAVAGDAAAGDGPPPAAAPGSS